MNENINLSSIYLITVFSKCEKVKGTLKIGSSRTVGFRHDLEIAKETVTTNMGDIWEYSYDYAIIEEVEPALYPDCRNRWFYKFNLETKQYEEINEPEAFAGCYSIGIG